MSQQQYPPPPYPPYPPPQQQYYPPPPQQQYYPPPPSSQYSQPPNYEHNYGQELNYGQANGNVAEKWNQRPKYQDLWAIVLFLIHLAGFIILSYFGVKQVMDRKNQPSDTDPNNNNTNTKNDNNVIELGKLEPTKIITLLVLVGVVGFFLSLIYMLLMQKFPKPLIRITLYLSIIFYFALAALFAYLKIYITAIFMAIFAIFYLICAFTWRDRIPFAAVLLETVTSLTRKYYGTIILGFVGLIVQVGWSTLWIVTLIGAKDKFFDSTCSNGSGNCNYITLYLVVLYLVFSFYWTSQVIKTIMHVTNAGVFATFYFLEGTPQGTGSTPTLSSLKRACTTSIGSICFGSLIIAILSTVRFILQTVARGDDGACGFVAVCLECILSWIESLVEYFNHYAYVQVAMFGKSYCESAKDTWKLIKDRGVDAIINDNLVGNVLSMGAIFIGVICAILGYGYIRLFIDKANVLNGTVIFILSLICFFLGFTMTVVITSVIDSGVATTFVALAEDPDALRNTKPHLFERIRREWPQVVQGMH